MDDYDTTMFSDLEHGKKQEQIKDFEKKENMNFFHMVYFHLRFFFFLRLFL